MRFLFDQNISHKILYFLPEMYAGSTTVKHEGLMDALDIDIWRYAKKNEFVIVTQDSDFNDLNSLYGFPPKIIWIRTGNLKTKIIADLLHDYSDEIEKFVDDNRYGCFEIVKIK